MTNYQFVMNGRSYELHRGPVVSQLAGVEPERIRLHAVEVGGTWYPVSQAFEAAIGRPRAELRSKTARRHLARLGFEMRGNGQHRPNPSSDRLSVESDDTIDEQLSVSVEWHTEADVQSLLVNFLVRERWAIRSVANTATKERGFDVVAVSMTVEN